uniref:Nuclease HARBI1 n=2 Tax=Diabrotica virgifera virgifera TaxID=50390 RepID=A0A6P7HBM4_DIAVI
MRGFPRVIGCIDGSQIKITSPGGNDAEIYRNRKGYFSINIQAVCSADGLFQSITARWPGSAHDQ